MGLCILSWRVSLLMYVRICVLYLIVIIKSEVWTISNCLWFVHETIVCTICLAIFLHNQYHRRYWPHSARNKKVVSLIFCGISKLNLQKYTMPEIIFIVTISSWTFVCVPKAWLWAHVQSNFQLEILIRNTISAIHKFVKCCGTTLRA